MLDCLIIGAGPAGLTAGIYLRRFFRDICIVDAGDSRASQIPLTRNYPGFPDGISGTDLLQRLRTQLERYDGHVIAGEVSRLERLAGDGFRATVGNEHIRAKTVLLATGIVDVEPRIAGFTEARKAGLIRFCPICDGYDFSNRNIGVIAKGEHGVRETTFIRNFSDTLSYIALGAEARLDAQLSERLRKRQVAIIQGEGKRLSLSEGPARIHLEMADDSVFDFDILYCALGSKVRSQLAIQLGAEHDPLNCLLVNDQLESSVRGLFAAGDVVSSLDQLSVATGQAAIASTAIHNGLS